jgi:hypothetical protein
MTKFRPVARPTAWLIGITLLSVFAGMAYSLWWPAVIRHNSLYWVTPDDLWSTVRAAHFIQWGGLSYVYSYHSALLTLPGFEILLAPVVTLCSALGLTESSVSLFLQKPQAWLLVGPFCLAFIGVVLFAVDALARRLEVDSRTRRILTVAGAVAVWPTIGYWGHPEDVAAIGLAIYALLALSKGRLALAGWLLGAALAMQLYVLFLIPLVVAVIGIRKGTALMARAAVLPGFLLIGVLVPDFHNAWWALTNQPNFPTVSHPTPWVLIAHHITPTEISAGPIRVIAFAGAIGLGFLARRWRSDWRMIFWLAAVACGIRCLFEPVIVPYYVMPAVAIAFVVGATRRRTRWMATLASGIGLTIMTFSHSSMWTYWFEMTGLMSVMFLCARPHVTASDRMERPVGSKQGANELLDGNGSEIEILLSPIATG